MSAPGSWTLFRRRSTALATVLERVELQRDARLPEPVPAPFADQRDLVGALVLRWHNRLTAHLEEHLSDGEVATSDPTAPVARAWAAAARDLPGLRVLLDRQLAEPATAAVGDALARATAKEHQLLAGRAGLAGRVDQGLDPAAVEAGRRIEASGRALLAQPEAALLVAEPEVELVPSGSAAFVARVKAVLAA